MTEAGSHRGEPTESARERVVRAVGTIGVWLGDPLHSNPIAQVRDTATLIEELGYGALWIGETPGHR
jgi:hypothetical protein